MGAMSLLKCERNNYNQRLISSCSTPNCKKGFLLYLRKKQESDLMRRSRARKITLWTLWQRVIASICYLWVAFFCVACNNTAATIQPSPTAQLTKPATSTPGPQPTPTFQPGPLPRAGGQIAYASK